MTPGRPGYGLPSFHLVSSLEMMCQSLCDGSQKLVFPDLPTRNRPTQPCWHEFVGASRRHLPRRSNARCKFRSWRQHYDSVRSVRIGEYALPLSSQKMPASTGEYDDSVLAVIQRKCFCLSVHVRSSSSGRTTWHADCSMSPQLTGLRHGEMDMSTEMNMSINMNMTPTS